MKKRIWTLLLALVLCIGVTLPALAQSGSYVIDEAEALTQEEFQDLEILGESFEEATGFPLYMVLISNQEALADTVEAAAEAFYEEYALGVGEDHSGAMLFVSLETRKCIFYAEGEAYDRLKDVIKDIRAGYVPLLEEDQWFAAMETCYSDAESLLAEDEEAELWIYLAIFVLIAVFVWRTIVRMNRTPKHKGKDIDENFLEEPQSGTHHSRVAYLNDESEYDDDDEDDYDDDDDEDDDDDDDDDDSGDDDF